MKINWTTVLVAFFSCIPPTILAYAAYSKAGETHDIVNSRMTEYKASLEQVSKLLQDKAAADATAAERDREESRKK